ncbi:MAG: UDPGP type 1 family protein [Victivallales bacterium]|nr:UDPGP type 1 family protein [Victivallales bacterium]
MSTKQELLDYLNPFNQTHLLKYWDELSDGQRISLEKQIRGINWQKVSAWAAAAAAGKGPEIPFERLVPAKYHSLKPSDAEDKAFQDKAREHGKELLRAGKVAAFTVAGGQGTRLGYDAPKGTYPVTIIKHKSLFQLFAEAILRSQEKYGCTIPWYIMTSVVNDEATRAFFHEHGYFGLKPENVMMFSQGMLPAIAPDGKALLAAKDSLALSPNGHGGSFAALYDSGAIADMEKRGITILSYWQVDNPLICVTDPLFIGLHDLTGSDMSSRALIKRDPMEKLGHFCYLDGKLVIVEYSDMPMALLQQKDADGQLTYRAGSPAMHVISRDFIRNIAEGNTDFVPHVAHKKVPCLNEEGIVIKPDSPNAIKLEFFLFDALPLAKNPLILEVERAEQFAPVKNAEGDDSPASCRAALNARAHRWLAEAGISVPENAVIELSPRTFADAEDVAANSGKFSGIRADETVYVE